MANIKIFEKFNNTVNTTDNQTIGGIKTFAQPPKICINRNISIDTSDNTLVTAEYVIELLNQLKLKFNDITPISKSYVYGTDITSNTFTIDKKIYNQDYSDKIFFITYNGIVLDADDYSITDNTITINSDSMQDGDNITVYTIHTIIDNRVQIEAPEIVSPRANSTYTAADNKIVIKANEMVITEV